jgi:hypothetical protein
VLCLLFCRFDLDNYLLQSMLQMSSAVQLTDTSVPAAPVASTTAKAEIDAVTIHPDLEYVHNHNLPFDNTITNTHTISVTTIDKKDESKLAVTYPSKMRVYQVTQ